MQIHQQEIVFEDVQMELTPILRDLLDNVLVTAEHTT